MVKPYREVFHIARKVGPRGGKAWLLTLVCGHTELRPRPRLASAAAYTGSRRLWPARHVKCLMCGILAEDRAREADGRMGVVSGQTMAGRPPEQGVLESVMMWHLAKTSKAARLAAGPDLSQRKSEVLRRESAVKLLDRRWPWVFLCAMILMQFKRRGRLQLPASRVDPNAGLGMAP